jgi:hypothetical protein
VIPDLICTIASLLSVLAAYYNGDINSRTRLLGFSIWNITNPVFAMLFIGMYLNWWVITTGLIPTIGMYLIFTYTSARGLYKHRKEVYYSCGNK